MSGPACKAVICLGGNSAKINELAQLIKRKFITDEDLCGDIIECSGQVDALLEPLIEKIKNS